MKLSKGEIIAIVITVVFIAAACIAAASGSLSGGRAAVSLSRITAPPAQTARTSAEPAALIDINTADAAELETLPGIGEKTAAAIIAYREEHGSFENAARIMDVPGIGAATFEEIRNLITVKEPSP